MFDAEENFRALGCGSCSTEMFHVEQNDCYYPVLWIRLWPGTSDQHKSAL